MKQDKIQLVIQTAFLGDLILALPFLSAIKSKFPEQKLWLVCRAGTGKFILKLGLVDHVIEIKKGDAATYNKALNEIAEQQVENLWCPHQSFRSAFFAFRISAKRKIGFFNYHTALFFSDRVKRNQLLPDPLRQLSLLQVFDVELQSKIQAYQSSGSAYQKNSDGRLSEAPNWAWLNLKEQILKDTNSYGTLLSRLSSASAKAIQNANGKMVLLFPGSVWATKKWSEQGFVELGKQHSKDNLVLVMGGPGEEALCESVAAQIPNAHSLAGKTDIYESLCVIANSKLVIANDSASSHLACLVDTPVVTCFGPTVLSFGYRPWGRRVWIAEMEGLQCRPCGKHGHHKCPRKTHECMMNLSSLEVSRLAKLAYSSV